MKSLPAVGLAAWLIVGAVAPSFAQPAAKPADPAAAAREREALRKRLEVLRKNIASREGERSEASDALQASEEAISKANRRLAEIDAQRKQAQAELADIERRIAAQQGNLDARQRELAGQLRRQYATGALTPWNALLSGDDPHELGRNLSYLGYVSQARAAAVNTVRDDIAALDGLRADATARQTQLDKLASEEKTEREALQRQSRERRVVLDKINASIQAERREADSVARDEARMTALIDELTRMLARQAEEARRAEIARREAAERAAKAAREREAAQKAAAERAAQRAAERARAQATAPEETAPSPAPAPIPAPAPAPAAAPAPVERPVARNDALPDATLAGRFEGLRGRLRLPVRGDVVGRFGTARGEGGVWRGVFVRAGEGAEVRAVAPGEVVFANWLRGFGNLIIVDHGGGYLSIYGNNQTLFKQVGDQIKAGDVVAGVGATGGQAESGLYFELRHRGKPIDPLQWVSLH